MARWQPAEGEICPRCKRQTEHLISGGNGEPEMIDAERCKPCGWIIRFDGE